MLLALNLSIHIETYDDEEHEEHEELTSILETLSLSCPVVKIVSFDIHLTGRNVESLMPLLSRTICRFEGADRLAIPSPIDEVALRHLAISPRFTQLVLSARQSQIEKLSLSRSDIPFSGAKIINLFELDLGSITSLLRPEGQMFFCTEFHLAVPPTPQLTLSFLTALASCPRLSSLQSIILDRERANPHIWPEVHQDLQEELLDDNHILSRDILQPLISFHNLRELSVDMNNPISLNDEELVNLVRGWPLLRFLRLVPGNGLSTKYSTLRGLLLLVAVCPNLERVDLRVEAREIPTSGVGMDIRSDTVKELNFPGSPINDPPLVAMFLSIRFPSIILLLGPPYKWEPYAEEWVQVRDYVYLIRRIKSRLQRSHNALDIAHHIFSFVASD